MQLEMTAGFTILLFSQARPFVCKTTNWWFGLFRRRYL